MRIALLLFFFLQYTTLFAVKRDTVFIKDPKDAQKVLMRVTDLNTGNLLEEGIIYSGRKEGIWRTYFDNKILSGITEYQNGRRNGIALTFASDASVLTEE